KTAIIKACLYEPSVNRTYSEMAAHYDTAILPTRPRRPRDKAKVEAGVLIMERWILGRLRHRCFHSLAELNEAIRALLVRVNDERPIRRLGVTRRQLLEEVDRPMLKPLPVEPYVFAEWRTRRFTHRDPRSDGGADLRDQSRLAGSPYILKYGNLQRRACP